MPGADLEAGASAFFVPDHQRCDELWVAVERVASSGDRAASATAWKAFEDAMDRHLRMEEDVLFPALDVATGMGGAGPIAVMLHEHRQMRALLAQMAACVRAGQLDALLDHGDTLMMLIQQHNSKEECIVYTTADDALGSSWSSVAVKLAKY